MKEKYKRSDLLINGRKTPQRVYDYKYILILGNYDFESYEVKVSMSTIPTLNSNHIKTFIYWKNSYYSKNYKLSLKSKLNKL